LESPQGWHLCSLVVPKRIKLFPCRAVAGGEGGRRTSSEYAAPDGAWDWDWVGPGFYKYAAPTALVLVLGMIVRQIQPRGFSKGIANDSPSP
jgi:hypothetical protein